MARPSTLTAAFVANIRVPGVYGDGRGSRGLSLRVHAMANGRVSKSWRQRVRIDGKLTSVGLKSWPEISLKEAREQAIENARACAHGIDPRTARRGVPTFRAASEAVIALNAPTWKAGSRNEATWRSTLAVHAAALSATPVDQITSADVMAVLEPIWAAKHATAKNVRHRISAVMKWSITQGHRPDDPAGQAMIATLPKVRNGVKHREAIHHRALPAALNKIRNAKRVMRSTRLSLEMMALCASRSAEIRGMRFSEVEGDTWTCPASRHKSGSNHTVPLSYRCREILAEARAKTRGDVVFPGRTGKPLAQNAHLSLLKKLAIACTPHGFRATFRGWCAENGVSREVAVAGLGHSLDKVDAAYRRTSMLETRREIMERYSADCLSTPAQS